MIYWFLFIIFEIYRNYRIIEVLKERPDYLGSFGVRFFFGLLCLILTYRDHDPIANILDHIPYIIFQLTSFWILFDIGLNLVRKKPLGYKGKDSGWLDKLPLAYYWLLKTVALITMIYTIVELI